MRDRWVSLAFAVGLGACCALGFTIGHHLPGVGTAVATGALVLAALLAVLFAVAALRHSALPMGQPTRIAAKPSLDIDGCQRSLTDGLAPHRGPPGHRSAIRGCQLAPASSDTRRRCSAVHA